MDKNTVIQNFKNDDKDPATRTEVQLDNITTLLQQILEILKEKNT